MNMNQKGFVNIIVGVVTFAILIGAVGYFVFVKKAGPIAQQTAPASTQTNTPTKNPTPTPTPSSTPSPSPVPGPGPDPGSGLNPTLTPKPSPKPAPLPTVPKTGDIEEIQTLLNKEQWVRVIVMLKGNEFTAPEFQQDDFKKKTEVKKVQDTVLIDLTEKDFQLSNQYQYITSFAGMVSKSGMEKLLINSQVISVSLDRLGAPY